MITAKSSHLRILLGTHENRSEVYEKYIERESERVTLQYFKSNSGVAGSASEQAIALRGLA